MMPTQMNEALVDAISSDSDINMFLSVIYLLARKAIRESNEECPTLVELGVATGNSTIALLSAIEQQDKGRLYSADIVLCPHAEARATKAGLYKHWHFRQRNSIDYAIDFDKQCDLIFIDSSHEADQTIREIEVWAPMLRVGGFIVFHDTMSRPDGVAEPIAQWLEGRERWWKYSSIDAGAGLGIMTRIR